MSARFGLQESVIQQICAVLAKYPQVQKAVLYGSRAKGTYKNGDVVEHIRRVGVTFYERAEDHEEG